MSNINGFRVCTVKTLPPKFGAATGKYEGILAKIPKVGYLRVDCKGIKELSRLRAALSYYQGIQTNQRGNALYLSHKAIQGGTQ